MTADRILAIDTSAGTSVGLLAPGGEHVELSSADPMLHAEVIGRLLLDVLDQAGAVPADISTVAVGMGPGPFTGLRVGIAAATAFALATGASLARLVSHDAPAWQAYRRGERGDLLIVTDARRREVYWTRYSLEDTGPVRTDGPGLAPPSEVPHPDTRRIEHPAISALALAERAQSILVSGGAFEPDHALYLRAPDATPSAGPKRVTR